MASKPETRLMRALAPKRKPDIETAVALQRAGQNAYKVGDFQSAIRSFTQALAANPEDIGIYDNRAATYSKLTQYSHARADARAMVKLAPNEDRGYLRLGKVLCLDGNFDKAVSIYEYGLQKLPANHSGRKVITQLLKKLQDRLAGGSRRDPFTALPLEMADLILQSFSFKQIVAILRVCKGWKHFLIGLTSLWMNIDLTGARIRVPWTSIRNYIHRSRAQVTAATITDIAPSAIPKVIDMMSRCPKLEHLAFLAPHTETHEFYPRIKEFQNLKSLSCGPEISLPHLYVGSILSALPKLEKASFTRVWDSHTRSSPPPPWPQNLPNMKSLTIASTQRILPSVNGDYLDVVPGLGSSVYPNLEELRLIWYPALSESFRFNPVEEDQSLPQIRQLELRGAVIQPDFYSILPASLQELRLDSGSIERADNGSAQILIPAENELPNLRTLTFNDAPWVNPYTLSLFLFHGKAPLRTLCVNDCLNLIGPDLVDLLSDPDGANPELENITEIGASGMPAMDDICVEALCIRLPNLKALDLSQTRITGCTVRMLADSHEEDSSVPKLETLTIKRCDSISRDAIDYGRTKGLRIITQ
ncbi:Tetratricopeptide-like helical [Penicillium paradoxum]|uniref:Tetratricopeptide-like helical n=1 Tax=Penicillium paradoxum TaxID=176176 RepID=UPI0025484AE7|nr:Tetratricopeptide-like helical [Penicillium paradoxum]KAJ5782112.1 Tetratricopeptide-like helical [Penicillium paradoxum]